MNATRTRPALLLCPQTLKKYHAELSREPKIYKAIRRMRDLFASTGGDCVPKYRIIFRYRAIFDHRERPARENDTFFRLICRLREAIDAGKIDEAINTLNYLLSLNGDKEETKKRVTKKSFVDPLACCHEALAENKYCCHEINSDTPGLGLEQGDYLHLDSNREPKRGDLISASYERGKGAVRNVFRFCQWEWDEIQAFDYEGDLVYIRPITVSVVIEIERNGAKL